MRVMVLFDLPTDTSVDRHNYSKFRRFLIKNGFMMMQESVYIKLAINQNAATSIVDIIKKNKPPLGLVQILTITEKQFSKIEIITGGIKGETIDTDERLLIL